MAHLGKVRFILEETLLSSSGVVRVRPVPHSGPTSETLVSLDMLRVISIPGLCTVGCSLDPDVQVVSEELKILTLLNKFLVDLT